MLIAAIVLAAGKSERMGKNKLLLCFNDTTLIASVLDALAVADVKVLVLGHEAETVLEALAPRQETVRIVVNQDYRQGMTSSFQKGLRLVRHADAAFLVLGDQPILDESLLAIMVQKLEDDGDALIVSPVYEGKKGHPVLFRGGLFDEIMSLQPTRTMRDLIHRHEDRLRTVVAPEWTTLDVDTPEDYTRILMKRQTDR